VDPVDASTPVRYLAVKPVFLFQTVIVVGGRNADLHTSLLNALG